PEARLAARPRRNRALRVPREVPGRRDEAVPACRVPRLGRWLDCRASRARPRERAFVPELLSRPAITDQSSGLNLGNARSPAYRAASPSVSSIRSSSLYLATRSLRAGAPLLIWPTPVATARSAITVSSVSPER